MATQHNLSTGKRQDLSARAHVGIVGSISFPSLGLVREFVQRLSPDTTIVSGGAAGVDASAVEAAIEHGLKTIVHEADWDDLGRKAGPIRYAQIVGNSNRIVAFWNGHSRGTLNTLVLAREARKPVQIIGPNGEEVTIARALITAEEMGIFASIISGRIGSPWPMKSNEDYAPASAQWGWNYTAEYLQAGEGRYAGGPATRDGWYMNTGCGEPMCCGYEGPFETEAEAEEFNKMQLINLAYPVDAPEDLGE